MLKMNDVVPQILERIEKTYASAQKINPQLHQIKKKIEQNKATWYDAHEYANVSAAILSQSILKHFTVEALPDGRLYFNIAERIIRPLLTSAMNDMADVFESILKRQYESDGIGIKPIRPKVNEDRIKGIIEKLLQYDERFK